MMPTISETKAMLEKHTTTMMMHMMGFYSLTTNGRS